MKRISQLPVVNGLKGLRICQRQGFAPLSQRCIHTTPPSPATVAPAAFTASGPPPAPPTPSAEHVDIRVARRRKQAELLKKGQDIRAVASGKGGGTAKTKRFWKDVHVLHTEGIVTSAKGLQVFLDKRPLRRPSKDILTIPHHKPHLATAIALEWDLLVSVQQALKTHLIPMTSLVNRALDIADEDKEGKDTIRNNIVTTMMRYLDTDSLLCWAPEAPEDPPGYESHVDRIESLRTIQRRSAEPIIQFLSEKVWPGVELIPVLDADSIVPKSQPQMTKDIIRGWVSGLSAFELAGLERGVLAGKGLLGAARLLVEWSVELAHLRDDAAEKKFGVEEAAKASSLEVDWQTGMWGAVEDTHDVEREDIRRQLGSVVLLVSGERK
ncbi:ATP synthase mitochondrial F1 complex assembly factor 2 [Ciborinia camelliae]|nr:ATP synthase mitochondrial F1 complex assembly factor 2 [Ciborinia camelliae]